MNIEYVKEKLRIINIHTDRGNWQLAAISVMNLATYLKEHTEKIEPPKS